MNWQERIQQTKEDEGRATQSKQEHDESLKKQRAEFIESKTPEALALIESIGVKNLLVSLREEVWKKGNVKGPDIQDAAHDKDFIGIQIDYGGIVTASYSLVFKYPAYVRVSHEEEYRNDFIPTWAGGSGIASSGTNTVHETVLGQKELLLRAGIVICEPRRPQDPNLNLRGFLVHPNSYMNDNMRLFYDRVDIGYNFKDSNALKEWLEQKLLEDSIIRARHKDLPLDLLDVKNYLVPTQELADKLREALEN